VRNWIKDCPFCEDVENLKISMRCQQIFCSLSSISELVYLVADHLTSEL
jgi:hypothetical protein